MNPPETCPMPLTAAELEEIEYIRAIRNEMEPGTWLAVTGGKKTFLLGYRPKGQTGYHQTFMELRLREMTTETPYAIADARFIGEAPRAVDALLAYTDRLLEAYKALLDQKADRDALEEVATLNAYEEVCEKDATIARLRAELAIKGDDR